MTVTCSCLVVTDSLNVASLPALGSLQTGRLTLAFVPALLPEIHSCLVFFFIVLGKSLCSPQSCYFSLDRSPGFTHGIWAVF